MEDKKLVEHFMSKKEVDRALVLSKALNKELTLKKASELLFISYSHTKRLFSRFSKEGRKGLISKKRGIRSNRAVLETKKAMISTIIGKHYQGCKPLFVSEKLKQYHEIKYSSEFIRQLMTQHGLWFPKTKKQNLHQRRLRRESEGELVQIDASDHDWFEGRGARCHLHIFVDDATSKIQSGYFAEEETTAGYYKAALAYFTKKGRPVSLYSDKRGTFTVNQGNKRGKTQFARAMSELGINMILAHSPQAKGRVERAFKTLQERLIWEMRIRNISSIDEANKYLPDYLEEHNKKFAKKATSPCEAHRALHKELPLKYILSTKEIRTVSKNLEVQYNNEFYQLKPPQNLQLKREKITAITTLDGELVFSYKGIHIDYVKYSEIEYCEPKLTNKELMANWGAQYAIKTKPSRNHPWR